ncbi:hypothetical protein [Geomicrobium sp. JCM 19039]|uniref:hypothetical protein n=1 Tax=Geomicrobium sp. JCM 19039 TaxID=1460636 RepID=UPI00045F15DA|nr:hypothetical protein [Geomicrobium sp. JCM 19039]GAK13457.1 hypothetical protein JCM19039_3304 [Geomicrobium sp. JCM 19039]
MATVLLTAFFIAGVFTAYTTFLMFVTWPKRKENRYKHVKFFSVSFVSAVALFFLFFFTSDSSEFMPTETIYATPDSLSTVEEKATWHIVSELGQVTVDNNEVIRDLDYVTNSEEDFTQLYATLTTEDNVTTDLIRSSTLNRSARVLQRLSQIEDVDLIHLQWDFYYEPEFGPGDFDTIVKMTVFNEHLQSLEWEDVGDLDVEEIASDSWEKPELSVSSTNN